MEWWQRLNDIKPALVIPPLQKAAAGHAFVVEASEPMRRAHAAVSELAEERLSKGRDWVCRDSDYGEKPAHAGVKARVNATLVQAVADLFGPSFTERLGASHQSLLLLLDTPQYGTLSALAASFPELRYCQQVVVPQADLAHYYQMIRSSDYYPGVRAQRLDHWLCANSKVGFKCLLAFLDYECRLAGAVSARMCPAADIMRYFRFGYPAEPESLLAITVGLEEPAATPEEVDFFVRFEAASNGYTAELRETWKYRMGTLLYVVRRMPGAAAAATQAVMPAPGEAGRQAGSH